MQDLRAKLNFVIQKIERARIAYSRHQVVKLVAVSKYSGVEKILDLYHCGQRAFGENKVQDLKQKSQELEKIPLEWHFIGNLQSNKINMLLDLEPALVHSVGSLELAHEIDKRCEAKGKQVRILLQVNSALEESKGGVLPQECLEVYHEILETCKNVKLEGLMCMGAHSPEIGAIEKSFRVTKDLFDALVGVGARTLSMGMSSDYEIAIANGANLLRVGSEIFRSSF